MSSQEELLLARARLAVAVAVRRHMLVDGNVTAVDFGLPMHRGVIAEDERAIRVHVRRKLPLTSLETAGVAPVAARIHEFPTDVVVSEKLTIPFNFRVAKTNLPSGVYRVEREFGKPVVTLVNVSTGQRVQMLRNEHDTRDGRSKLVFESTGQGYSLKRMS